MHTLAYVEKSRSLLLVSYAVTSVCNRVLLGHSLLCSHVSVGLSYSKTTGDSSEQTEKELALLDVYEATGPECQSVVRPFLCFTFFPKCRRKYDYGQMPCDSTCEQIKVEQTYENDRVAN